MDKDKTCSELKVAFLLLLLSINKAVVLSPFLVTPSKFRFPGEMPDAVLKSLHQSKSTVQDSAKSVANNLNI
ncbi:hypothetical protein AAHA92_09572 [Salvia divinorum]|uniref:Uncharacterized protein n=1 Tax=Salvia divinorum TaxID=28513 RepID=A0ABD1HUK9_SALDI